MNKKCQDENLGFIKFSIKCLIEEQLDIIYKFYMSDKATKKKYGHSNYIKRKGITQIYFLKKMAPKILKKTMNIMTIKDLKNNEYKIQKYVNKLFKNEIKKIGRKDKIPKTKFDKKLLKLIIKKEYPTYMLDILNEKEKEIRKNLLSIFEEKEFEVYIRIYGLFNFEIESQASLAQEFGVSRQRINQILKKAQMKIERSEMLDEIK